jgi:hypothetical protein
LEASLSLRSLGEKVSSVDINNQQAATVIKGQRAPKPTLPSSGRPKFAGFRYNLSEKSSAASIDTLQALRCSDDSVHREIALEMNLLEVSQQTLK